MEILNIFPGAYYIQDHENHLLAGLPPEIIKVLMQKKLSPPDVILLPDIPLAKGESQVAIEFPLYHNLFMNPNRNGKKLIVLGNTRRVEAARELLKLCLMGPNEAELKEMGISPVEAKNLYKETSWFHLKNKEGIPLSIDDLIDCHIIEDETLDLGWINIQRVSKNVFKVNKQNEEFTFSLDVSVEQIPPYPINFDLISTSLVKFGIEVLGGSTGFSATNASSGLALCYNSNYMLIDAIPYLNHHLKARGIARNQVYSLFLSHVHDDHCNILSLLQYNRRITILTTNIIFQMTLKKLSLIMDKPESELKDYFIFIPLEVNKATNYYGMKITPFYSVHSIPTIGGIFEVIHQGKSYRILFTGDTQSLKDIKSMIEKNVISEERYNSLKNIYTERWDLLLADGGEGLIHGDPSDAEDSESDRIVFLHLDKLPDKFETQFSIASSGKRFTILPGQTDYWLTRTIEFLLEYFPKMPPGWISNLLGDRDIRRYNAGDIIIRQGSKSQGEVFIILTGYAQVISHDGKTRQVLAQIEAGELIGEMASIIGKGQRSASVVALSPVVVSTFSEEAFRDFIYSLGYEKRLEQLWLTRNYLQKFEALRFISQPVLRSIAERVHFHTLESVNTPATFSKHFKKGSLLFPVEEGLFLHSNTYKTEAKPNRDIIYISPELQYSTKKKAEVMVLDSLMAKKLRKKIPLFRFFWEEELRFPSA